MNECKITKDEDIISITSLNKDTEVLLINKKKGKRKQAIIQA